MATGWRIIDSNDAVYKSWYAAVVAYRNNPQLTFRSESFTMEGYDIRDVTHEIVARAKRA